MRIRDTKIDVKNTFNFGQEPSHLVLQQERWEALYPRVRQGLIPDQIAIQCEVIIFCALLILNEVEILCTVFRTIAADLTDDDSLCCDAIP